MTSPLEETVRAHTVLARPPLVPELELHLVTETCPLWRATEADLARLGLGEPYWAFCWPGGQALARYVLDHPEEVAGRSVFDLGAGCGVEAIAALRAGARDALAADTDPLATAACALNARHNGVGLAAVCEDGIGRAARFEVVLVGDLFYERALSARLFGWLRELARAGTRVLVGDPHRGFLPREALVALAAYDAPSDVDVGGRMRRPTGVFALPPPPA